MVLARKSVDVPSGFPIRDTKVVQVEPFKLSKLDRRAIRAAFERRFSAK
jgi:hypothetical protein